MPKGGEPFNLGKVSITWDNNQPVSDDDTINTTDVTHEIEYTTNYQEEDTDLHTLIRRIPCENTSF